MSLTNNNNLLAALHENGVNTLISAVRQENPWLFNYATQPLGGNVPPGAAIRLPAISIPETDWTLPLSFDYAVIVQRVLLDFPDLNIERANLPPEISFLENGEILINVDALLILRCEPRNMPRTQLSIWLIPQIISQQLNSSSWDLGLGLRLMELVDITPDGLESSIECIGTRILRDSLFPNLRFRFDPMLVELGPLRFILSLGQEVTTAGHQLRAFFNIDPPPPPEDTDDEGGSFFDALDLGLLIDITQPMPAAQHFLVALDEEGVRNILEPMVRSFSFHPTGSLGPFFYDLGVTIKPGTFDLIDQADQIRLREWDIHTDLAFGVSFDIPEICIGGGCLDLGIFEICAPEICFDIPAITLALDLPTIVSEISADLSIRIYHDDDADEIIIGLLVNPLTLDIDLIDLEGMLIEAIEDGLIGDLADAIGIGAVITWILENIIGPILDLTDDVDEAIRTLLSDLIFGETWLGIGTELIRFSQNIRLPLADFVELPPEIGNPVIAFKLDKLALEVNSDQELVVSADIALPE
ncbi:MAG: hypothetical protein R3208_04030 [Ketobacteraceae bacterium]|nr:hypothetical protein [Ketobacteraceae bacterium]